MFYFGCIFREYYVTEYTNCDEEFYEAYGWGEEGLMMVGMFSYYYPPNKDRYFKFIFASSTKLESTITSTEKWIFKDNVRNPFKMKSQKFN